MTPREEIQTAHDTLVDLRIARGGLPMPEVEIVRAPAPGAATEFTVSDGYGFRGLGNTVHFGEDRGSAFLFAGLIAAVDPLIDQLRSVLDSFEAFPGGLWGAERSDTLAIARAINAATPVMRDR